MKIILRDLLTVRKCLYFSFYVSFPIWIFCNFYLEKSPEKLYASSKNLTSNQMKSADFRAKLLYKQHADS